MNEEELQALRARMREGWSKVGIGLSLPEAYVLRLLQAQKDAQAVLVELERVEGERDTFRDTVIEQGQNYRKLLDLLGRVESTFGTPENWPEAEALVTEIRAVLGGTDDN